MSELVLARNKTVTSPATAIAKSVRAPSAGTGRESAYIDQGLYRLAANTATTVSSTSSSVTPEKEKPSKTSLPEQLYNALAAAKVLTSQVAMHLEDHWRAKLFKRLDDLLSVDNWDELDRVLVQDSFSTFLRTILVRSPRRQPALGISQRGYLLADWTTGRDSLVIEFLPKDELRWVLVRYVDGERESAAGLTPLRRLLAVLAPYDPDCWFEPVWP